MPNQAITVSPSTDAAEQKAKLTDFGKVEPIVNLYARSYCKKFSINPSHIEVFLCRDLGGIMKVKGGSVVEIYLQWPDAQPSLNTLLGDAFRLMRKYPVRRTMEVVPFAYTRTQSDEIKKRWRKEKFVDESDIILDLLPKQRLRVRKTETTVVEDVVTGESVSYVHEYPTDRFDMDATSLWLRLSRIVRDKHPDVDDLPVEIVSSEPLLDEVLEQRLEDGLELREEDDR